MFDFGDFFRDEIQAEGVELDAVETSAALLSMQLFPDTASTLLPDFERNWGIVPEVGATNAERRLAIIAKMRARGGLSIPYYKNIAAGLGFNIDSGVDPHLRIVEGEFFGFLADVGRADIDKIYDQGGGLNRFTWNVYGTNVESHPMLTTIFTEFKPAGTQVVFTDE